MEYLFKTELVDRGTCSQINLGLGRKYLKTSALEHKLVA